MHKAIQLTVYTYYLLLLLLFISSYYLLALTIESPLEPMKAVLGIDGARIYIFLFFGLTFHSLQLIRVPRLNFFHFFVFFSIGHGLYIHPSIRLIGIGNHRNQSQGGRCEERNSRKFEVNTPRQGFEPRPPESSSARRSARTVLHARPLGYLSVTL